jgi:hypothetical protein
MKGCIMKNSLRSQVFSHSCFRSSGTDDPEKRVCRRGGTDFGFPKRAKPIKIASIEEIPAAQRKPEQGHTGCPGRI